ncbi:MAG TPA: hypothetical protein VMU68_04955 [Acidimicrobiales bacterium]|nr:hypothetical protein [Acidimicrobiales bacterium]
MNETTHAARPHVVVVGGGEGDLDSVLSVRANHAGYLAARAR